MWENYFTWRLCLLVSRWSTALDTSFRWWSQRWHHQSAQGTLAFLWDNFFTPWSSRNWTTAAGGSNPSLFPPLASQSSTSCRCPEPDLFSLQLMIISVSVLADCSASYILLSAARCFLNGCPFCFRLALCSILPYTTFPLDGRHLLAALASILNHTTPLALQTSGSIGIKEGT